MLNTKTIILINLDIKHNPTPYITSITGIRASPIISEVLIVPEPAIPKACFRNQRWLVSLYIDGGSRAVILSG
jgi:hypothetical protein